jgi:putrescine transport system permease protein
MAYGIARAQPSTRNILLLLIILPFWISFLLRVYAWMGLLNNYGVINNLLVGAGIIDQPLQLIYTDFAVYLGLVYSYLPFMILPLYATLERMDPDLVEAAQDLGASPSQAFRDITWPLARPGVIAGCLLVFIPAMGEYVIPYLLGGPDSLMIGRVLFDEFFQNRDWPLASSVAIVLLTLLVVPIVFLQRSQGRDLERAA